MGRPGPRELAWLRERGVRALVSLTEAPPGGTDGFDLLHHPIPDMTRPGTEELARLVDWMHAVTARGDKVVAHCEAGLGRTGTLLAAYLVGTGLPAPRAIERVRRARPGSIETPDQERAVHDYDDWRARRAGEATDR